MGEKEFDQDAKVAAKPQSTSYSRVAWRGFGVVAESHATCRDTNFTFGIWDKVTVVYTVIETVRLRSPDRSRHPPDKDITML